MVIHTDKILKAEFNIDAQITQIDMSFTYLEDEHGTEYRAQIDEERNTVAYCFREKGNEDWLDLDEIELSLEEAV